MTRCFERSWRLYLQRLVCPRQPSDSWR